MNVTNQQTPRNVGDPEKMKVSEDAFKRQRRVELEDMRQILDTAPGRRFLWRVLATCGVYEISFTGNSETFFREGKRSIGLRLIRDITEAAPEALIEMMRANNKGEFK